MFERAGVYEAVGIFSRTHFFVMAICFVLVFLFVYLNKDITKQKYMIQLKVFSVVLTALELVKIIWNLYLGYKRVDAWLPLYFCSIFIYALWFTWSKNERVSSLGLSYIAIAGASCGSVFLICPSTSFATYPIFHFQCLYSMFYHSIMVYAGIMIYVSKSVEISRKIIKDYFMYCAIFMLIALVVNVNWNGNMMFLMNPSVIPVPMLHDIAKVSLPLYTVAIVLAHLALGYIVYYTVKLTQKLHGKYFKRVKTY